MNHAPEEMLERGVAILAPTLAPHGFTYVSSHSGKGSGGAFASGTFTRGERRLSLHHRWGLGIVTFEIDRLTVPHEHYISFLGVADRSKLLWTPLASGLDRYQALQFDIETLCDDFTTGDGSLLIAAANDYANRMEKRGVHLNAESVGDLEKRQLARDAFKCERYADVIELIGSVAYPELLTGSETRMVEIARSRGAGTEQPDEREPE
jgi:hypothetical protein